MTSLICGGIGYSHWCLCVEIGILASYGMRKDAMGCYGYAMGTHLCQVLCACGWVDSIFLLQIHIVLQLLGQSTGVILALSERAKQISRVVSLEKILPLYVTTSEKHSSYTFLTSLTF